MFARSENLSMSSDGLKYDGDDKSQAFMPTAVRLPSSITLPVNKDIPDYLKDEQDFDIRSYDTGSETRF